MHNTVSATAASVACAGGCLVISRQLLFIQICVLVIMLWVLYQLFTCWRRRVKRRNWKIAIAKKGGMANGGGGGSE